ncbi:hypothetical protein DTO271D3_3386 [Paecilomyces variotii]|nr:hypothetical protein DTO271D3_3386 [Paecilomyces variotii]
MNGLADNPTPPTTRSTPTGMHGLNGTLGGVTPIATTRGRLTAHQELILLQICQETFGDRWDADYQCKDWIKISEEFQKRARRTFSWQSCQRRFKESIKKERTRIAMNSEPSQYNDAQLLTPASEFVRQWIWHSERNRQLLRRARRTEAEKRPCEDKKPPLDALEATPRQQPQQDEEQEEQAKLNAWQERMDNWMNTSTDPETFVDESRLPAVDPAHGVVSRVNTSPPETTSARPVSHKDLKEISDKIDRVAENILDSTKKLLKEMQLQQRREMEAFKDRIAALISEETDLISQNIMDASEDASNDVTDLAGTISFEFQKVKDSETHLLKLRRDVRYLLKVAIAEGKIKVATPSS